MVIRLIFLLLLPLSLLNAEFTALISKNPVNVGESFTLILTLRNASAKTNPTIDSLNKSFSILSQKQSYNTLIVNGEVASATTWKITLVSQKEGDLEIPSIKIETNKGLFSTYPLKITVKKNTPSSESDDVVLKTEISTAKPFKNEPFIYTVRIMSKKDLVDIKMPKFTLENAHVEPHGEPKTFHQVIDGVNIGIIEFDYLITPLKSGGLKIPPNLIQGGMPGKRKVFKGAFFEEEFDPFAMMQGFDRITPFSLVTEEIAVDVQQPSSTVIPWIAAKELTIEEIWDESQNFQVGEPFTRTFKISSLGLKSNQLPGLNDQHKTDSFFKIYTDKPDLKDSLKEKNLVSSRTEIYTLIPQKEGNITLPELNIAWWDVINNKKAIASIQPRVVAVLPPKITVEKKVETLPEKAAQVSRTDPILYTIIGGLLFLFLIVFFWAIALQKKIKRLKKGPVLKTNRPNNLKSREKVSDKKEKLPDLNPT